MCLGVRGEGGGSRVKVGACAAQMHGHPSVRRLAGVQELEGKEEVEGVEGEVR